MKTTLLPLTLWLSLLCATPVWAQWKTIPHPAGANYPRRLVGADSVFYTLTYENGLYRTFDSGKHWQWVAQPNTEGAHMIEMGKTKFFIKNWQAIYFCNHTGSVWDSIPNTGGSITCMMAQADTLWYIKGYKLYRNKLDGASELVGSIPSTGACTMHFYQGAYFLKYASRVFRSNDTGQTWQKVYESTGIKTFDFTEDGIYWYDRDSIGYSTDGMLTFQKVPTENLVPFAASSIKFLSQGGVLKVLISDVSHTFYWTVRYSIDHGQSWLPDAGFPDYLPVVAEEAITCTGGWLVSGIGVYFTGDYFKTFEQRSNGIPNLSYLYFNGLHTQGALLAHNYGAAYVFQNDEWEPVVKWETGKTYSQGGTFTCSHKRALLRKNHKSYWVDMRNHTLTPVEPGSAFDSPATVATQDAVWALDDDAGLLHVLDDQKSFLKSTDIFNVGLFSHNTVVEFAFPNHLSLLNYETGHRVILDKNLQIARSGFNYTCPFGSIVHLFDGERLFQLCGSEMEVLNKDSDEWTLFPPVDFTTGRPIHFDTIQHLVQYGEALLLATKREVYLSPSGKTNFYPLSSQPMLADTGSSIIQLWVNNDTLWVNTAVDFQYLPMKPMFGKSIFDPKFKCSPNPSSGQVTISSSQWFNNPIQLNVLDVAGRTVTQIELVPGKSWNLDLAYLPRGAYLFHFYAAQGLAETIKWIKSDH